MRHRNYDIRYTHTFEGTNRPDNETSFCALVVKWLFGSVAERLSSKQKVESSILSRALPFCNFGHKMITFPGPKKAEAKAAVPRKNSKRDVHMNTAEIL